MIIPFTKMQSCGNDYIYIDATSINFKNVNKLAKNLSIRRLSVGSDGLVLIKKSEIADYKMEIYNADGSEAKMCGNAIRCVGKFLYDKGLRKSTQFNIETLSGIKKVKLYFSHGLCNRASVEIGKCKPISPLFDKDINIFGENYKIFVVSVGNPHAVLVTEKAVNEIDLESVAKYVNKEICHGVNVEVINILSSNKLQMRVYERGSGETLACGTGASASVGSLIIAGYLNKNQKITVSLLGGRLGIVCNEKDVLTLVGEVKTVYDGAVECKEVAYAN